MRTRQTLSFSLYYDIDAEYRGKTKDELLEVGKSIREGTPYQFDAEEVASVVEYAHRVLATPPHTILSDLFKLFGPVMLIMVSAFLLLYWSK